DGAGFDHGVEHDVAAIDGALRVTERAQVIGTLNQPGEQGAFIERQLAHILAEVNLSGFTKAVDIERAPMAKRHLVGIHLKYLLLVKAMLKLEGDDHLQKFSLELLLRGKKEELGELHGDGGSAFGEVAVG